MFLDTREQNDSDKDQPAHSGPVSFTMRGSFIKDRTESNSDIHLSHFSVLPVTLESCVWNFYQFESQPLNVISILDLL